MTKLRPDNDVDCEIHGRAIDFLFAGNLPRHFQSTFNNWNRRYWFFAMLASCVVYIGYQIIAKTILLSYFDWENPFSLNSVICSLSLVSATILTVTSAAKHYTYTIVIICSIAAVCSEAYPSFKDTSSEAAAHGRLSIPVLLSFIFLTCRLEPSKAGILGVLILIVCGLSFWNSSTSFELCARLQAAGGMLFQWFTLYLGLVNCSWIYQHQAGIMDAMKDHMQTDISGKVKFWGLSKDAVTYFQTNWKSVLLPKFTDPLKELEFAAWRKKRGRTWLAMHCDVFLIGQLLLLVANLVTALSEDASFATTTVQLVSAGMLVTSSLLVLFSKKHHLTLRIAGIVFLLGAGASSAVFAFTVRNSWHISVISILDPLYFTIVAAHSLLDDWMLQAGFDITLFICSTTYSVSWLDSGTTAAVDAIQCIVLIILCTAHNVSIRNASRLLFALTHSDEPGNGNVSVDVGGWQNEMQESRTLYHVTIAAAGQVRFALVSAVALRERLVRIGSSHVIDEGFDSLHLKGRHTSLMMCKRLERLLTRILSDLPDIKLDVLLPEAVPQMNICVQTVGSRGDVQPFISLATALNASGHRCRLATHEKFRHFVTSSGIEFFPLALTSHKDHWQPETLMEYAQNVNLSPHSMYNPRALLDMLQETPEIRSTLESLLIPKGGDLANIGPWPSVVAQFETHAVIANPPSYAHVHIAERLGIPLHMVFTMPWSSTTSVGHPLADSDDKSSRFWKQMSYRWIEFMQWQGIGLSVYKFREFIGLKDRSTLQGISGRIDKWKIPFTYCFSDALLPRPDDWGKHIDITGFILAEEVADTYTPPTNLATFISGQRPFYIGFGSITADLTHLYRTVLEAARNLPGTKFIIQKGWCDLSDLSPEEFPDNVFLISPPPKECVACKLSAAVEGKVVCKGCALIGQTTGDGDSWEERIHSALGEERCALLSSIPHDWLYKQCSGVMHHGGAGTTAVGLASGLPTIICAFFGDQGIWGQMIERHGCGKMISAHDNITASSIQNALVYCQRSDVKEAAVRMGQRIVEDSSSGKAVKAAVDAFHKQLPIELVACDVCVYLRKPERPGNAERFSKTFGLRLCKACAEQVADHAETELRTVDWGYASRSLLRYHFMKIVKSVTKLGKRTSQGYEASGFLGVYLGLITAVVEITITLICGPFWLLHALWVNLRRSKVSAGIPGKDVNRAICFDKTREVTRDAVLEIQLIRSRIENRHAAVSCRFNSETLHSLD